MSPYPQFVDPSPTDSNGTDNTDIDENAQDTAPEKSGEEQKQEQDIQSPSSQPASHEKVRNASHAVCGGDMLTRNAACKAEYQRAPR